MFTWHTLPISPKIYLLMCLSVQVLYRWPLSYRFKTQSILPLCSLSNSSVFGFSKFLKNFNLYFLSVFYSAYKILYHLGASKTIVETNCYSSVTWLNKLCAVYLYNGKNYIVLPILKLFYYYFSQQYMIYSYIKFTSM